MRTIATIFAYFRVPHMNFFSYMTKNSYLHCDKDANTSEQCQNVNKLLKLSALECSDNKFRYSHNLYCEAKSVITKGYLEKTGETWVI